MLIERKEEHCVLISPFFKVKSECEVLEHEETRRFSDADFSRVTAFVRGYQPPRLKKDLIREDHKRALDSIKADMTRHLKEHLVLCRAAASSFRIPARRRGRGDG